MTLIIESHFNCGQGLINLDQCIFDGDFIDPKELDLAIWILCQNGPGETILQIDRCQELMSDSIALNSI